MKLKCKNQEAKEKLIQVIKDLHYENYISWYSEFGFEISKPRFKEVRNRIEAIKIINDNPNKNIKICDRCNGKGILKEFITALNPGICFKCKGYGYINYD